MPFTENICQSLMLTSLVAQKAKCLPTMQETWVQSLGREDLLEKEMANHSRILAWRIPWMEKSGRLQSVGPQRVGHDWATSLSLPMLSNLIWLFYFVITECWNVHLVVSFKEVKKNSTHLSAWDLNLIYLIIRGYINHYSLPL